MKGIAMREAGASTAGRLPRDLEEAAASRLAFAFVSVVAMIALAFALAASFLRQANIGARAGMERPTWTIVVALACSLGMLLLARSRRAGVPTKLTAGVGYMIARRAPPRC